LICPHDGGFAVKLTEKIEDLVLVLFLPLYFALSGLSTNLGLLNDGITWAYVIGVIAVAFSGKIIGGTLAARSCKLVWRESLTIGVLMSCKGLVELIVLNIGLQAKILSTRTFTMFVVMALVTTVSTTPLTTVLYPLWYQKKLDAWKKGEIDWDDNHLNPEDDSQHKSIEKLQGTEVRRLLVYLRLDSLPSLFTFIALLGGDRSITVSKTHRSKTGLKTVVEGVDGSGDSSTASLSKPPLEVHGVRMLELTERTSSVMKVSEVDEHTYRDPVVNAFRTFAQLSNVAVSGGVFVVPESSYAETLTSKASDLFSDLVLIPWSETGSMSEGDQTLPLHTNSTQDHFSSGPHATFIQQALQTATCNTAIFINRGFGGPAIQEPRPLTRTISGLSLRSHREAATAPVADRSHHIYFPFFGGIDDRVALRFVLQLAQNSNITATIIHLITPTPSTVEENKSPEITSENVMTRTTSRRDSTAQHGGAFEAVDAETLSAARAQDTTLFHTLRDSLPSALANRVVFVEVRTSSPLVDCLDHAKQEIGQSPRNAGDLIIVGRGEDSRFMGQMEGIGRGGGLGGETRKTLGIVAESVISGGVKGSVLVIKAGGRSLERGIFEL